MQVLKGKICLVAGATRGAGRGIACMLGQAGATVYCTGRSSHFGPPSSRGKTASPPGGGGAAFELASRPETIEETAEMVTAYGGLGIPVPVDHTREDQVQALFERVRAEQGRLDVLVNDVWGGDELSEWGKPFWELSIAKGLLMQQRAVHSHIITSRYAVPLMLKRHQSRPAGRQGLIVEITDGDTPTYRGNSFTTWPRPRSSAWRMPCPKSCAPTASARWR